jgi:uncharacterized membrane protein
VSYIVVGQMERAVYAGPGMQKFEETQTLWREIFRVGNTVVYEVDEDMLALE